MELHNLKPAEGSVKKEKEQLEEEKVQKKVELQREDIREQNQDQVIQKKSDLKVVSNRYKEEYLNLDLRHPIELNIME